MQCLRDIISDNGMSGLSVFLQFLQPIKKGFEFTYKGFKHIRTFPML